MKKVIILLLLSTTYILSNINTVVSILPEQTFLKAIGGDKVNITLMVQPGNSPHTYEPKPSQMLSVAKAELYFSIGVEFENVWLAKFQNLNHSMHIVNLAAHIEKMAMGEAHHEHESMHDAHEHHEHTGLDPHIWTSPENVKTIAQNIFNALAMYDAENKAYYKQNLEAFLSKIDQTDTEIKALLSELRGSRTFMVFHPSWAYFAKAYGLEQVAVEVEGKEPKPKELVRLLKEAKEEKVKAIFTQPEFSDTTANIIAKELHIPVVKVSPLAPNWSENLLNITKAIAGKH